MYNEQGPLPLRAEVDSCSNSPPPCILTNGQRVFIPIVFTVPRSTTTLKTEVMLYFTDENGILYNLPVEEPRTKNTCKYLLDATCPVRKGEILLYPFQTLIYEPNFDDGQQVAVEIMIYDNKVEEVMCLRVEFIFHQKAASPTILDA
ncbi:uncharacterized protein [Choristoneura fumiferana]|uniref:uncharacterized protein n=1 Tax=Choristoneura fumiferana TaxID=7141 RepID=UPI003D156B7E